MFFVCLFCFLGPHPWHMEVPRLGVKLEIELLAYATATATWDLNHVCNLHHSSRQCRIPDPLIARPGIKPPSSWILVRFTSTVPQQELPPYIFFSLILYLCLFTISLSILQNAAQQLCIIFRCLFDQHMQAIFIHYNIRLLDLFSRIKRNQPFTSLFP